MRTVYLRRSLVCLGLGMMICHDGFTRTHFRSLGVSDSDAYVMTIEGAEGREFLHLQSTTLRASDPVIPGLVARMARAMQNGHGQGIAAVQVGYPVQLVLLKRGMNNNSPLVLLNPTVVSTSDQQVGSWEFCLSVPWGYAYVLRSRSLRVHYQTLNGDAVDEDFQDGEAVVLQQEIDHLNGKLISDARSRRDFISVDELEALIDKPR